VTSESTDRFWEAYGRLPERIQERARNAYQRFERDPRHPGLRLKKVHASEPIYSVRISRDYRALGAREGDTMIWFWIGSHEDYDRLLQRL